MVEHRLLSVDVAKETGSTTVEPAHEALLRNWKELRAWLEEEADALSSLDALRKAAADWWKNGKVTDWIVHVGSRLGMADQICQRSDFKKLVTEVEEQYLRRAHMEEAERRKPAERAAMLLAEIGHEIGTPLAALGATAKSSINFALRELTSDRRSPPSEIVAKLNQSQDRIEQLLEVLRTTMDSAVVLADVASDRKSLRMKYTALIPLIERSWSEAARTAGARRGQSDLSAPQMRMKSYKTDVRVRGDEDALLGALREIFKNSIIYTIDSGDRARQYCEVAIAETIGEILVSVSNFGPEIPIEERQRIFEPGYRGSSGRIRAARGVGMGLSFARQIMQLHGGSISLVSSSKVIDPNKSASDAVEGGELCRNTFELRFSKGGDFVNI
jgi:signal transduction histidine kinase